MNTKREFIPKNPNQNFSRNNGNNIQNNSNNNNKNKKSRSIKNLSPAKKFRLRLRRAKLQKRQQAREEYFEHDMRENNRNKRRKPNNRYRNYKRQNNFPNKQKINGNANNNEKMKIDKNAANLELVESTSHSLYAATASSQEIMSKSLIRSEQAKNEEISSPISLYPTTSNTHTNVENFSTVKCCCHCACSGSSKRKPRRKLSSPYLGDFSQIMHFAGGSKCLNAANELTTEVLNKTIMTQHEKFIKTSGGQINYDLPAFSTYMHKSIGENTKIRNERNGIRTMRLLSLSTDLRDFNSYENNLIKF